MKKVLLVLLFVTFMVIGVQNVSSLEYIKKANMICTETDEYKAWKSLSDAEKENVIEPIRCKELFENKGEIAFPNTGALVSDYRNVRYFNLANFDGSAFNGKRYMTSTKNQMIEDVETSICWSFSTMSCIESAYLIKNGGQNYDSSSDTIDFSEKHMAMSFLPAIGDYTNPYGFNDRSDWKNSGSITMLGSYLARIQGPVLETYVPFNLNEPTESQLKQKAALQVENSIWSLNESCQSPNTINNMKQLLVNNGAIYSTTYAGAYFNTFLADDGLSYYCPLCGSDPSLPAGHAVTIVGWDDDYSASKFNRLTDSNDNIYEVEGNGAWIVRNTYSDLFPGSGSTPENYYYISYYDSLICDQIVSFAGINNEVPDNVYTHSNLGYTGNIMFYSPYLIYKNVFDKKNNTSEMLTSISILGYELGDKYEVYYASGDESNMNNATKIGEGTISYLGYTTIDVTNTMITQNKYSLFVKYEPLNGYCSDGGTTCASSDKLYIYPIQKLSEDSSNRYYISNPTPGNSFYSVNGSTWIDSVSNDSARFFSIVNAYTSTIDYNFVVGTGVTSTGKQLNLTDGGFIKIPISELNNISSIDDITLKIYKDNTDVTNKFITSTYTTGAESGYKIELGDSSVYGDLKLVFGYKLIESKVDFIVAKNNHILITSIQIQGDSEVAVDGTLLLSAVITPNNPTNGVLNWSSSNDTVATVDNNGVVTGKKAGTVTITAASTDESGKKASTTITVININEGTGSDNTNNEQGKINPATGSFISIITIGFISIIGYYIFKKTKKNKRFL